MNKKVASASSGGDQPPFNPKDQSQKKPDTSQQRVSMPSRREFLKVGAPATVGSGLAAASGLGLASSSAADCKLRARLIAINPWSDLMQTSRKWLASAILALFSVLFTWLSQPSSLAAAEIGSAPEQITETYFPGTEKLGTDEMRVIACGTGMPQLRKSQAGSCFLVELGNGDKFIFDVGSGTAPNLGSLAIPFDYLDKVFLTHLHTDHCGDLAALWVDGWVGGRHGALKVWGPSGQTADMGVKNLVEKLKEAYKWDYTSRLGVIPGGGSGLEVHEFDYKQENKVVYEQNGVVIRSWPAVHCIDGAVSYSLEWHGLKFVYSGDTFPNKWYVQYGKNADIAIHECFPTPQELVAKEHLSPQSAILVATTVHTAPAAFGLIMESIKPRLAVAYHFFNDFDTRYPVYDGIRRTYKGPLTMAMDLIVWNITKKDIKVRSVVVDPHAIPAEPPTAPNEPEPKQKTPFSQFIEAGQLDVSKELDPMVQEFKKDHGMK